MKPNPENPKKGPLSPRNKIIASLEYLQPEIQKEGFKIASDLVLLTIEVSKVEDEKARTISGFYPLTDRHFRPQ